MSISDFSFSGIDIDKIIIEFNIDTKSTSRISIQGLNPSTKLFKVHMPDFTGKLFIIDSEQGREIACHPHIVGEPLKKLSLEAALEAVKAINELTNLSKVPHNSVVVENVLRAAPGYELQTALKKCVGREKFNNVWIRPRYGRPSYRDHDKAEHAALNIIYEDFNELPHNRDLVVLKSDTEATGKTGQISIERLVERCNDVGSSVQSLILYGFISVPGLKLISETAEKHGIELMAFAVGNVTDLAFNGYDMTLYGVDESYWKATQQIRKMGSIVDIETLEKYLPEFIPGSDQPGDWSNRQTSVHVTKDRKEPGGIRTHLQNSIKLIRSLMKISNYTPWQKTIARKELQLLYHELEGLKLELLI
jgi:hypothetical protein